MAFGILALLPIMLIIITILLFSKGTKPGRNFANIRPSRRVHYSFLLLYLALLLVATIVAEAMESKKVVLSPEKVTYEAQNYNIYEAIINGDQIDPSKVFLKRTHSAGDKLMIYNSEYSSIFIKRKDSNDGVVEEIVYSPTLFANDYDFSDRISVVAPVWTQDTVTLQPAPFPVIEHVSYHDAIFPDQFSGIDIEQFMSYDSSASSLIIHLRVPKDLVIDATYKEQIEYLKR